MIALERPAQRHDLFRAIGEHAHELAIFVDLGADKLRSRGTCVAFLAARPARAQLSARLRLDQLALTSPLAAFFSKDLTQRLVQRVRQRAVVTLCTTRFETQLNAAIYVTVPICLSIRGLSWRACRSRSLSAVTRLACSAARASCVRLPIGFLLNKTYKVWGRVCCDRRAVERDPMVQLVSN